MNPFFSPAPVSLNKGVAVIRIIVGALLIYHGQEVFNPELMRGYAEWDTFKGSAANFIVYAGKSSELIAGLLLFAGFLTRIGAVLTIGTLAYITFFIGHGKFWYEDQHPFLFVLLGLFFLFTGPGAWSVDEYIFKKKDN